MMAEITAWTQFVGQVIFNYGVGIAAILLTVKKLKK